MGFVDILLMTGIIAGAIYLLYRSIWKKKGHCHMRQGKIKGGLI
jgi:hypothetical protein